MKIFANQILTDPEAKKRIGLYQLGNHRARMGVITGLPSIYLNNPKDLKLFIKSGKNVYVVMRQSDWQNEFSSLPMTTQATDIGWKKSKINKGTIESLLKEGLNSYLLEHSESYILLKAVGKG